MSDENTDRRVSGPSVDRRSVLSGVAGVTFGSTLFAGAGTAESSAATESGSRDVTPSRYTPLPEATGDGRTRTLDGTWRFALAKSDTPPSAGTQVVTPDYASGEDATIGGDPDVVTDPSRRALDLGGDAYVTVGDADSLDFTDPGFTVELTFRYGEDTVLFSKGNSQYSAGVYGGSLSFWTAGDGGWPSAGGGDLSPGRWYTATFAVDDAEIRVYVDGERVGTTAHDAAALPSTDVPLALGYNAGTDTQGSPAVDSLRVYDAALDDERVASGFESPPSSARAWLSFDDVSDSVAPDASGAGNAGTLANDPAVVAGRDARSLALAGDGYVSVPARDGLDLTTDGFTLRTAFRYGGGSGVLVNRGGGPVSRGADQFTLRLDDGTLSFDAGRVDGTRTPAVAGAVTPDAWHTATVVVDGSSAALYVDGERVDAREHGAAAFVESDAPVVVGGDDLALTVAETAAFGTALDAARVRDGFRRVPESAVLWLAYEAVETRTVSWRDETVPGQWGYDGYVVPDGASDWYPPDGQTGWYRRSFDVPADWAGERLLLRFGAAYSAARVYVNGTRVAEHVGGYTPFEVDVSDVVDAGESNTLAVGVSQRSPADEMSWQNVTGGITRGVTLAAVPRTHLSDCTVRTALDGADGATVSVTADVTNAGDAPTDDATVAVTLTDPDGRTVASDRSDIGALEPGARTSETLTLSVSDPQRWHPERPALYDATVDLAADGASERVSERVGIREVGVDGNDLLLNGEPVTLRGVNWEEVDLRGPGQAVSPSQTREDVRRLAEANVNYVRTAHFPVSEAFLEACDEYGIVVEEEAPHMFIGRDRGDPYPDLVVQQTREMIERDRNRPSVCIWSLANESNWFPCFADAAAAAVDLDPTRPIIFDHDRYAADDPWHDTFDLRADHYPAFRTGTNVEQYAGADAPMTFNEYGHLYCYDDAELVTDPGLRDQWGLLFETVWERVRRADGVAGGAVWAGGDHLEQWGQYFWGALDRNRRERPEFWHLRKVYAPVQFSDVDWHANGHRVSLTVENRHDFVNLSERTLTVDDGVRERTLSLDVPPGDSTTVTLPVPGGRFEIAARHPAGHRINEFVATPETPSARRSEATQEEQPAVLSGDLGALRVEAADAGVSLVDADGATLVDGVDLALTPMQTETGRTYETGIDHRPVGRTVTDVRRDDDGRVEVDVDYDVAAGTVAFEPADGGSGVRIDYEFALAESVDAREVGLSLSTDRALTRLAWTRDGQWSVYPDDHVGRLSGTAPAFPDGSRPESEGIRIQSGQPWKDDATSRGSNDFRATKRNVRTAALADGDERGVRVDANGDRHVRARVRSEAVDLLVLQRSISGTNAASWLDRHHAVDERPTLEAGRTLAGRVRLGSLASSTERRDGGEQNRGGSKRGRERSGRGGNDTGGRGEHGRANGRSRDADDR